MIVSRLFVAALMALTAAPIAAHEFWIEAEEYQVAPGSAIRANFKNGQEFEGNTLSFFDRSSTRLDMAQGGKVTPLTPRNGDRPAVDVTAPDSDALIVILHEKTAATLTYREWAKFAKFAAHKDFPNAEADHSAAGWPRDGFKERYTRHAKALIAVGSGAGRDQAFGLQTEFVALTNPYAADFDGQMKVALTYNNAPRADAQVEVFDRDPTGAVTITLHRTDGAGHVTVPVTAGHDYLFDAVVLRASADAGSDPNAPVWDSLWAALTFHVPE